MTTQSACIQGFGYDAGLLGQLVSTANDIIAPIIGTLQFVAPELSTCEASCGSPPPCLTVLLLFIYEVL